MRKLIIATAAILAATTVAEAQNRNGYNGYNGRGGYNQQYRGGYNAYRNNGNRYVQNNYYGNRGWRGNGWNNGGAIAAGVGLGLLGGLIGGALINQPAYAAPAPVYNQPVCQNVIVIYPDGTRVNQVVCN